MSTKSIQVADVQSMEAAEVAKPTAAERLAKVLDLIDRIPAKPDVEAKWGKAIGLLGGGSVYINRSNADIRASQKQVAEWAAAGLGTPRGPQRQYLRISF